MHGKSTVGAVIGYTYIKLKLPELGVLKIRFKSFTNEIDIFW